MTKIYVANTKPFNDDSLFEVLFQRVSEERKEKINRFRFRKDKNLSLAAGILQMKETDVSFNISHSGEYAICAFSDNLVGCDIEKWGKADLLLAKKHFAENEYEYILRHDNKEKAFFDIWTLKESFVKTIRIGLPFGLSGFSVIGKDLEKVPYVEFNKDKYYFCSINEMIDGYSMACCRKDSADEAGIIHVDLQTV